MKQKKCAARLNELAGSFVYDVRSMFERYEALSLSSSRRTMTMQKPIEEARCSQRIFRQEK